MKPYKTIKGAQNRIKKMVDDNPHLFISVYIDDISTQKEIRLTSHIHIRYQADQIKSKKDMNESGYGIDFKKISEKIFQLSLLKYHTETFKHPTPSRSKSALVERKQLIDTYTLDFYNRALKEISAARIKAKALPRQISALQDEQKELLKLIRESNSKYLAQRKAEKQAIAERNTQAIADGKFWKCTADFLKVYFQPPFSKNHYAGVSRQHRAALFIECRTGSYKGSNGWYHRMEPSGLVYLCGIDDNGDEWGHIIDMSYYMEIESTDGYGNPRYSFEFCSIEDVMGHMFGVHPDNIDYGYRQGDVFLLPVSPLEYGLENVEWKKIDCGYEDILESHTINGYNIESCVKSDYKYYRCKSLITLTHTSHQTVMAPPGNYRLHTLDQEVVGSDYD